MSRKPRVTIIGNGKVVRRGDTTTYYYSGVMVAVRVRRVLVVSDTASADAREFVASWDLETTP